MGLNSRKLACGVWEQQRRKPESHFLGNPKDRFCGTKAHFSQVYVYEAKAYLYEENAYVYEAYVRPLITVSLPLRSLSGVS